MEEIKRRWESETRAEYARTKQKFCVFQEPAFPSEEMLQETVEAKWIATIKQLGKDKKST